LAKKLTGFLLTLFKFFTYTECPENEIAINTLILLQ